MNPSRKEGSGEFSNSQVVRMVGKGISATFINYLGSQGFVEAKAAIKGQRHFYTYSQDAVDQIRGFWAQKQQGITPKRAAENLQTQIQPRLI